MNEENYKFTSKLINELNSGRIKISKSKNWKGNNSFKSEYLRKTIDYYFHVDQIKETKPIFKLSYILKNPFDDELIVMSNYLNDRTLIRSFEISIPKKGNFCKGRLESLLDSNDFRIDEQREILVSDYNRNKDELSKILKKKFKQIGINKKVIEDLNKIKETRIPFWEDSFSWFNK